MHMTKLLFGFAIPGAMALPSFIAQQRGNECRFATEGSTSLSAGTYAFQQFYQQLQFDFVIKIQGECLDLPLVYLRDQIVGLTRTDADTIRFSGEIQATDMELILNIPSTNTCVFEMQQGYLSHELLLNQNCPVGMSWAIDFQSPDDEKELMQDFLEIMDQEIPKSIVGLSLIDGISNYVIYDYKRQWESLSKDKRDIYKAVYRRIREVYIKIEPFITGDLSQPQVAASTAKIACAHLNSFIPDPNKHVDFKTIPLNGFNRKWMKFANHQLPTFPEMVFQSKNSYSDQCLVSNTSPGVIASGTYVFRNLLPVHFEFQIKATGRSCLQHHPSVLLRTDSMLSVNIGTITTEGEMMRVFGDIESENEMLLSIPSSKSCVYQLVQASLTLQLSTSHRLDEYCQIGHQLDVDWEKAVAVDLMSTETRWNEIPKSVTGISLADGIWNYISLNYETKFNRLSKDEGKSCRNAYIVFRYAFNRIERFIMGSGDMTERSNVERAIGAACEHLNSRITNPKDKIDSQTVLLSVFYHRWNKYGVKKTPTIQADPSKLPTTLVDLRLIDAIQNYVIYDYKTQFETLSAGEKKPLKNAYDKIRSSYLRIEPYQTGDLSERKEIEATIQAALILLLPDAQVYYETITVGSFYYRTKPPVSRKRLRIQKE